MENKILNNKRKLSRDNDSEEESQEELSNASKSSIILKNKKKKARKIKEKRKVSNSSRSLRIISVLKGEKAITLTTEKISEFYDFIYYFNCLFYIKDRKRYYLIYPEIIEHFYRRSDYQILS